MKTVLLHEKLAAKAYNNQHILDIAQRARAKRDVVPSFSSENEAKRLKEKHKWLFTYVKEAKAEDITNLKELEEMLLQPGIKAFPAYQEYWKKHPQEAKDPKVVAAMAAFEKNLNIFIQEVNVARVNEFEMNYKNFMSLLSKDSIKFDDMVAAKEKLYESNSVIFGAYKQMAELVGAENLPPNVQTVLAVSDGLEALEIEVNRFLLMKVKLVDRLQIDMSQLNTFLKYRSIAAPVKRGSAAPHSTGTSGPSCTTILSSGVCQKN